jgi:hypothetical protein
VTRVRSLLEEPPPPRPVPGCDDLREIFAWERRRGTARGYPQYLWSTLLAARTASALRVEAISVIEFGVAGGNGLVALESAADAAEEFFDVRIEPFGFDTAAGLPPPRDYRDVPFGLRAGDFRMEEAALRTRLRRAQLLVGLVSDTVSEFVAASHPPVGFVSVDLDYYSSTVDALTLFDAGPAALLPRIACYFDDIAGVLYCGINGEEAAINDFNSSHSRRKIAPVRGLHFELPRSETNLPWPEQIYLAHILDHHAYCEPERTTTEPSLQRPLRR